MKTYSSLVWGYTALLLIGGIIGFVKAGSLMSLIAAGSFAALLILCGYGIWKGNKTFYTLTLVVLTFLLAFFSYRFSLTYKMMPSGMMMILTAIILIPLSIGRKKSQLV